MTAPLTDEYLAEIEARRRAATPGLWITDWYGRFVQAAYGEWPTICETDWCGGIGSEKQKANGLLIANAPADIDALLAEVRRLRGERPICPFCRERMTPRIYDGYYDRFSFWECDCDEEDMKPHLGENGVYCGGYTT